MHKKLERSVGFLLRLGESATLDFSERLYIDK